MVMSNPRDPALWTPRTQEFTGGYNPREMLGDYDVNPNEDADGLSHHSRQSPEDYSSTDQRDPKKRRERALQELTPAIPHIKMKPAAIDEEISRQPQREGTSELLESALGVDMGLAGRGISQAVGANVGPIRSPTGQISYQTDKSVIGVPFSQTDILQKSKRRYKGRKYEEDEESEEEEKKSKKKRKRLKRRKGKSKKTARGGREPKSQTKRRAASAERNLNRFSKRQAFHPNQKSLPLRNIGSTHAEGIPLRLRDPVAWERKKAYERNRRAQGAMPRGMSHHYDTSASGGRGGTIGGTKGTKLPSSPKMGTNPTSAAGRRQERISPGGVGDPLGTSDALPSLAKSGGGLASLNRAEVKSLMRKIEQLLGKLNRMKKWVPEHGSEAKVGNQAGKDKASAPHGMTTLDEEKEAYRMFDDTSLVEHIVSKR